MIKGIGIDIVEIERIAALIKRQPRFPDRILTANEKLTFERLPKRRQKEFLAGRFAAKEAFSKAYGTGIGKKLSFLDIEVGKDENGKPFVIRPVAKGVHLSITHTHEYAAAQVIIEVDG